jgi:hypothetical protein
VETRATGKNRPGLPGSHARPGDYIGDVSSIAQPPSVSGITFQVCCFSAVAVLAQRQEGPAREDSSNLKLKINPPIKTRRPHRRVLTTNMQIYRGNSRHAFQPRSGNVSRAYGIVEALCHDSLRVWFAAKASERHGETPALKYRSTTRAIRRLNDVQTLIEGERFFVRRSTDREVLRVGAAEKRITQILARVIGTTNSLRPRKRVRPKGVMQLALRHRLQAVRARGDQMEANQHREEIDKASRLAAEQAEWISALEEDNTRLKAELSAAKGRLADETENLKKKDFVIQALKKKPECVGSGQTGNLEMESLLSLALRPDPPSPLECLDAIQSSYTGKCIVLQSAKDSAREMNLFSYGRRLLEMLIRLVTHYRIKLLEQGDNEARKVFGKNEYAAKESKTVMGNKTMRGQRIFEYEGEQIEMVRHLKIGADENITKTIRVHFYWDAGRKKIVIAYGGEHFLISSR